MKKDALTNLGRRKRERIRYRALTRGQGSPAKCTIYAWAFAPLLNGGHDLASDFIVEVARIVAVAEVDAQTHGALSFAEMELVARRTLDRLCSAAERHGESAHLEAWSDVLRGGNPDRSLSANESRVGLPY